MNKYSIPQSISPDHFVEDFDCGEETLNTWLKKKALKNEIENNSRTTVICVENKVVAYYSICTGCVYHKDLSRKYKQNSPDPIPSLVLGRLAVDLEHQGNDLSLDMIQEVYLKAYKLSELVGIKVVVVNALNEKIVNYYKKFGFVPSKTDPLLLLKSLAEIKASYVDAFE